LNHVQSGSFNTQIKRPIEELPQDPIGIWITQPFAYRQKKRNPGRHSTGNSAEGEMTKKSSARIIHTTAKLIEVLR